METVYLTYFNTLVSIVVCFIFISYIIHKILKKLDLKRLEKKWPNDKKQYDIELATRRRYEKEKINNYLKQYLKKECFNCRTFLEDAKDDYFCVVEGQCPGIDLTRFQKWQIKKEKK
jgi:hypothetical protein